MKTKMFIQQIKLDETIENRFVFKVQIYQKRILLYDMIYRVRST